MSRMSELWQAKEIIESLGGQVVMPAEPDELVVNHLGGALLALQLCRRAVRAGGVYRKDNDQSLRLAREMLDEIAAAWVKTERESEAA